MVVEVSYDQLTGDRFRHGTRFERWRPDKDPRDCTMDQLERPVGPASWRCCGRPGAAPGRPVGGSLDGADRRSILVLHCALLGKGAIRRCRTKKGRDGSEGRSRPQLPLGDAWPWLQFVVFAALGLSRFSYTSILPSMQHGLGLTNTQAGTLATANLAGYMAMAIVGGALASRFGPRRVVTVRAAARPASAWSSPGLSVSYSMALGRPLSLRRGRGRVEHTRAHHGGPVVLAAAARARHRDDRHRSLGRPRRGGPAGPLHHRGGTGRTAGGSPGSSWPRWSASSPSSATSSSATGPATARTITARWCPARPATGRRSTSPAGCGTWGSSTSCSASPTWPT